MGKFKNLDEAQTAFDALEKESIQKDEVIAELRKDLTAVKKEKSVGKVIVEHNKEKYAVEAVKFNHGGKDYTAEDLKTNKELTKELVELGVGFLVKQA